MEKLLRSASTHNCMQNGFISVLTLLKYTKIIAETINEIDSDTYQAY